MTDLEKLADLLLKRNKIDYEISQIIGRPCQRGHIGEYIAAKIFNIELEYSASSKGIDGVFLAEPLQGKTVNIKFYGKQEGILDIALGNLADYYLVFTGSKSQSIASKGGSRPLIISNVYLFDMQGLVNSLQHRGLKIGIATSIANHYWYEAEIYPNQRNSLKLSDDQIKMLEYFK